jgi:hypothetical protein
MSGMIGLTKVVGSQIQKNFQQSCQQAKVETFFFLAMKNASGRDTFMAIIAKIAAVSFLPVKVPRGTYVFSFSKKILNLPKTSSQLIMVYRYQCTQEHPLCYL